jgi:hypothetical protein
MYLFAEEIEEGLRSGDPARIAQALRAMVDRLADLDTWPVRAPAVADLAPFGAAVPEPVLADVLRIWEDWGDFSPPFGDRERHRAQLDLLVRTGSPLVAYRGALDVRVADEPGTVAAVVADVAGRDPAGAEALSTFLDHVLDGSPEVRAEAVDALAAHAASPAVRAIRAAGLDRSLTEAERARLG